LNSSSGIDTALQIAPTISQSSSAGYTALLVNPTESSLGSGTKSLLDLQVGGSSKARFDNTGKLAIGIATPLASIHVGTNGTASTPGTLLSGTWFTGGTSTTTKPQVLVEPTGTTSTGWSTNGTGIGINAASGFGGNLLDVQVAGVSKAKIDSTGALTVTSCSGCTGASGVTSSGTPTAGQATFWTSSSAISGDNSFFWDNTSKRLGIGDNTPAAALTVGAADVFQVNSSGAIAAATGIVSSGSITFTVFLAMAIRCSQHEQVEQDQTWLRSLFPGQTC
jgi:hypothetical protein